MRNRFVSSFHGLRTTASIFSKSTPQRIRYHASIALKSRVQTEGGGNSFQPDILHGFPNQNLQRFREFELQGKVFAVTGGARGLGLAMAEALMEAGGQGM
jgi:hypothetical protein